MRALPTAKELKVLSQETIDNKNLIDELARKCLDNSIVYIDGMMQNAVNKGEFCTHLPLEKLIKGIEPHLELDVLCKMAEILSIENGFFAVMRHCPCCATASLYIQWSIVEVLNGNKSV